MSKYESLFGDASVSVDPLIKIEKWLTSHPAIKTKAKRINYILDGKTPETITSTSISEIGSHHVDEATQCNACVDTVVQEFAELKNDLYPAEKLILEALELIDGNTKGKGLGRLLGVFKPVLDASELRFEVSSRIRKARDQFDVKVAFKVEPFIEGLEDAKYYLDKIIEGLDNTVNALDYLIESNTNTIVQDLARRRKEMFVKSMSLQMINQNQLDSMLKMCEQKKTFVEELKMTVIPIIENILRSSVITGNEDMTQISEALKKIL